MIATITLLDIAGLVALLLWGVHMVQSGIQRAFGPHLRRLLGAALGHRWRAFLAGMTATAVLQSSTATGLMVAGFTASGLVGLVPALAAMLGANVGTTLIVQLLSFDVAALAPVAILVGLVMFRRGRVSRTRDLGRVAIGLGLMLLALTRLVAVLEPYEDAPSLRLLLGSITSEPILDVLLAAGLTWMAHSSVAVVLLVMSLASQGIVPPEAAFALVLGANLGTALNPVLESHGGPDPSTRRLPIGNLLMRAIAVLITVPLLGWIGPWLVTIAPDTGRAVANFHFLFNAAAAVIFFPLLPAAAALLRRMLPRRISTAAPDMPLYLDPAALDTPAAALANASRESLRMADALDTMLQAAGDAFVQGDRLRIAEARGAQAVLSRLRTETAAYLAKIDPDGLDETDNRRLVDILAFVTNLEHAGDIAAHGIVAAAAKRQKHGVAPPPDVENDIGEMIARLVANLRTAGAVFMTGDLRLARTLLAEKEVFRDFEARASEAHFRRLRDRSAADIETSALQLDLLRDLRRINAHLAAAAQPVLEQNGELLRSRLRQDD